MDFRFCIYNVLVDSAVTTTKMIQRSVIFRGLVSGSGLHVSTVDCSLFVLVRCLTNINLSEPIRYCSIKELEVNKELSRMKLDKSQHLNKCVDHILKKDIQVPEVTLMLNKRSNVSTIQSRSYYNIPAEVKMRRWGPNDNQIISDNMDALVTGIRQKRNKDAVLESIFTPSKLQWHTEKTNIIGCYLGQGLPDLRLPLEIFRRAERLFSGDLGKRVVFTETDDKQILEYMSNEGNTDRFPYASLSKRLGHPVGSIQNRYIRILKPGCNKAGSGRGKYTDDENKEIMQIIFKENKNAQHHYYSPYDQVWVKLSTKLNRGPFNIFLHWEGMMRPHILMFEHGLENVDFRPILVDYCVDNNIMYRNETNWSEIGKDARFSATTAYYLQKLYNNLVVAVKKTNPGMKDNEVTSETLQSYLATRATRTRNYQKDIIRLCEDYVNIKNVL